MDFGFSVVPADVFKEKALGELLEANNKSAEFGLVLTREEASQLIEVKSHELSAAGRIEFGSSALKEIIEAFCDSPYLNRQNYTDFLSEMLEIFYSYKNETLDLVSDSDLISYMKACFNGVCQGSTELLKTRELDELSRQIRSGDISLTVADPADEFITAAEENEIEFN
ncbi:MAG: DUF6323 family protein [Eubacteriales bacterium]|nr:DUF6323 family protein [Eubacteriales bacterium]MDD4475569.1 DUF6323 family protein [Eubacteriales bacterium]